MTTSPVEKAAALQAVRRTVQADGTLPRHIVRQIAGLYGVNERSLRRWYYNGLPDRRASQAWKPENEDYVEIAVGLNVKAAWLARRDTVGVSYRTYLYGLAHGDQGLLAAALKVHKALVRTRTYLVVESFHRNYEWSFDHTMCDIWVTVPGRKTPVRPWMTVVGDNHSRALLCVVLIAGKATAETVAAALTDAATGDYYDGTYVGGLPVQVVFDNALEHLGGLVSDGLARLGIAGTPIRSHSSWENGKAEKRNDLIQRELFADLPGYTGGGDRHNGELRCVPEVVAGLPTAKGLLSIQALQAKIGPYVRTWNTERTQTVLQGRTPVEKWNSDPTEIQTIGDAELVANMMVEGRTRKVNSGIFFGYHTYLAAELNGLDECDVHVRYLPRNTSFIAVSVDGTFSDVFFAHRSDVLPASERSALLAERNHQNKLVRQIEADAMQRRAHAAAVANEAVRPADEIVVDLTEGTVIVTAPELEDWRGDENVRATGKHEVVNRDGVFVTGADKRDDKLPRAQAQRSDDEDTATTRRRAAKAAQIRDRLRAGRTEKDQLAGPAAAHATEGATE